MIELSRLEINALIVYHLERIEAIEKRYEGKYIDQFTRELIDAHRDRIEELIKYI